MSDRNWRVTVRFKHEEGGFHRKTSGGLFHVWVQQIAPTLEEEGWVDGRTLSRDEIFVYQKIVRSMGLDIGYGGTDRIASFQTSCTESMKKILFKTTYADKFGTDKKNSSGRDWAFKGGKQNWPASPKWKITVELTHNEGFVKQTTGGKFHVWAKQMEPTVEEEHYVDGRELSRACKPTLFEYKEIARSYGLDIGEGGTVQKDSITTSSSAVVNKLLFETKYAGKFGTRLKNAYGISFGIDGDCG